jgi:hypothetical protein
MSAIFSGAGSLIDLASSAIGAAPSYPVLSFGWMKLANVTQISIAWGVSDNTNSGLGQFDLMEVVCRGDTTPKRFHADAYANGAGGEALIATLSAGTWVHLLAYYRTASSRYIYLNGVASVEQTTTVNVAGLARTGVGARVLNIPSDFYVGRVAEWGMASGNASINTNIAAIVAALQTQQPSAISLLAPYINIYQPFLSNVNEGSKIGPSMTAANMTYDGADHPSLVSSLVQQAPGAGLSLSLSI